MAPVAMMRDCPAIKRGVEATVPSVPGLVSEIVVPEVGNLQFAISRALNHIVISFEKLGEAKLIRALDIGHQ